MKPPLYLFNILFIIALSFNANADDEATFKKTYDTYVKSQATGNVKATLPHAKSAFEVGVELFDADSKDVLTLAGNYTSLLVQSGDVMAALRVYSSLLATNERYYGKYAKSLIPILKALHGLQVKSNSDQAKATKQRYVKLLYRHNPDKIASSVDEGTLKRPNRIQKVQQDILSTINKSYSVYEGKHWVTLYPDGGKEAVEIFDKQLEISYASIRSFLISANLTSKPIQEKQLAVLFKNDTDYLTFIEKKDLHDRSKGSYEEDYNALLMFDSEDERSEWKFFEKTNSIIKEAAQQILVSAGIFSTDRRFYPYWLYEGISYSFEFNDIEKPFGPHTQNLSASNWSRAQSLVDAGDWITLKQFVRMTRKDEKDKGKKEIIYIMGTYLIRFLYEKYPDEFVKYFGLLPKQAVGNQKSAARERTFRKAFGKPESLEKEWKKFLRGLGITFT